MTRAKKLTTVVSPKGQVTLPEAIRKGRGWQAGTRLIVEETVDGVLLKPAGAFARTYSKDVFGVLAYEGEPKTLKEMEAGIASEARRRGARDS